MQPLISVGIPFYNAEAYLALAIQSVLLQSYHNWELILIDDGSSDASLEIANYFSKKDSRVRVISDGDNKKLPSRLNQIIKESKGDFLARMDADDIMHPQRLEKQYNFLKDNTNFDVVSSGLISIDSKNRVKGYRAVHEIYCDFTKTKLSYPIVHPSVMARKSWFERNRYSTKYPRAEDFELWTKSIINNDFHVAVLPDLLLFYREEGNLSIDKIVNSYKDTLKIYSDYHNPSFINADVLKLNLKIIISNIFYYTGNLQKLSQRRNRKFEWSELEYYQNILNKVIDKKV